MAKKTEESPFQALEEEAYHAFREWPVWLALRERELDAHLAPPRPPDTQIAGTPLEHTRGNPPLAKKGN